MKPISKKRPDGTTEHFSPESGWNWVEDENGKIIKSWKMGEQEPDDNPFDSIEKGIQKLREAALKAKEGSDRIFHELHRLERELYVLKEKINKK